MHFSLGVLSETMTGFHKDLEPYDERGAYEYMEFVSTEEEDLERYQEGKFEKIETKDGRHLSKWDDEFSVVMPRNIPFSDIDFNTSLLKEGEFLETVIPDDAKEVRIPIKEMYDSFEEYMKEEFGEVRDVVNKAYGYWTNPNAKYDWYQLGGRWKNLLLVREEAESNSEVSFFFKNDVKKIRIAPEGYKWVDTARLKDIEWEKMKEINKREAIETWDEVMKELKKEDSDKFRLFLNNGILNNDTKESYIYKRTNFYTYSTLNFDGWTDNENTRVVDGKIIENDSWKVDYMDNFIKKADQHLFLSIIDCHI